MTDSGKVKENHPHVWQLTDQIFRRKSILSPKVRLLFYSALVSYLFIIGIAAYEHFFPADTTIGSIARYFAFFLGMGAICWLGFLLWKELDNVKEGLAWFETLDPRLHQKRFQERQGKISATEKDFADVVLEHRITTMQVANGVGKDRGCVVIDVEWDASERFHGTLYLYRDEGEMQTNVNFLRLRDSAIRLDFAQHGKPIRHVDGNVRDGRSYNYYAWIEVWFYELALVALDKKTHIARTVENKVEFAERKLTEHELMEKFRAAQRPPSQPPPEPTLAERVRAHLTERLAAARDKEEAGRMANDYINSLNVDEETKETLWEEARKVILGAR